MEGFELPVVTMNSSQRRPRPNTKPTSDDDLEGQEISSFYGEEKGEGGFTRGWSRKRPTDASDPFGSTRLGRSPSQRFAAHASRMNSRRKESAQNFQSHLANEKSFMTVLGGAEMEDPMPNVAIVEPQLQLPWPFLLRLKVNTFAVPLGLSSQAQLWGFLSGSAFVKSAVGGGSGIPDVVQWVFWVLSLSLLVIISFAYVAKAWLYWGAVTREWAHPIRSSFVLTPLLTSLTLVTGEPQALINALHPNTEVLLPVFMVLSAFVLYVEMASYRKWLFNEMSSLSRANPSYQLAVVGNFIVASLGTKVSGGAAVETACGEISMFFFSIGILYELLVFFAIQNNAAGSISTQSPANASLTTPPSSPIGPGATEDLNSAWGAHEIAPGRPVSAMTVSGWGRDSSGLGQGRRGEAGGVIMKNGGAVGNTAARGGPGAHGNSGLGNMGSNGSGDNSRTGFSAPADKLRGPFMSIVSGVRLEGVQEGDNEDAIDDSESAPGRLAHGFSGRQLMGGSGQLLPPLATSNSPDRITDPFVGLERAVSNEELGGDGGNGRVPGEDFESPNPWWSPDTSLSSSWRAALPPPGHASPQPFDVPINPAVARGGAGASVASGNPWGHVEGFNLTGGGVEANRNETLTRELPSEHSKGKRLFSRLLSGGVTVSGPRPREAQAGRATTVDVKENVDSGHSLATTTSDDSSYVNGNTSAHHRVKRNSLWVGAHDTDHGSDAPPAAAAASTSSEASNDEPPSQNKLSTSLHPIYFLFVAPPSAAAIAWTGIAGEFDALSRSLYFIAGFLYLFLALGNWSFLTTASFSIAWWAYTFPSSTFAFATILYAEELDSEGVALVGLILGLASTILVLVVLYRTVKGAVMGTLFGPDPVLSVRLQNSP